MNSESKHTPGPWRIEMSIYKHMACEIVGERGIAQVWNGPHAMADSHLMAAAPDLVGVLNAGTQTGLLRAAIREAGHSQLGQALQDWHDQIDATLAHAEGKAS